METSKLKNMVVLRNLPSNIVEEAIIILKTNKKVTVVCSSEKAIDTNSSAISSNSFVFTTSEKINGVLLAYSWNTS